MGVEEEERGGGGREEFVKLLFQESQGEAKQAGLGLRSPLAPPWACDRRSQPRAAPPSACLPWENHRPHAPGGCLQGLACPSSRLRRETCLVLEGQRPHIEETRCATQWAREMTKNMQMSIEPLCWGSPLAPPSSARPPPLRNSSPCSTPGAESRWGIPREAGPQPFPNPTRTTPRS